MSTENTPDLSREAWLHAEPEIQRLGLKRLPDGKFAKEMAEQLYQCWVRIQIRNAGQNRSAYSRKDLAVKLREWMEKNSGKPSDYKDQPEQRDRWYRDAGLIYDFICDHFPE